MESSILRNLPPRPRSITETDLDFGLLAALVLKTVYTCGIRLGYEIADSLELPYGNIIDELLLSLRREKLIEVLPSPGVGESSYRYAITDEGRKRARELMDRNQYVGPAPVSLESYSKMVNAQSTAGQEITRVDLKRVLSHLVLSDAIIDQLGPALNSGRSVFLFGNTGNGKTSIGQALGNLMAGAIWIPFAVTAYGQIIKVFDALHHRAISEVTDGNGSISADEERYHYDQRWVRIYRPLIVSGGELELENLELVFDPTMKYFEAPQQMKGNGGVFLVDDLGRGRDSARDILNRWIVPLDKRVDHLTLTGGYRIDVPFDVLIAFATNIEPEDLVDEAFLRRIRNRIHITDPSWEEFREIFRREAVSKMIPYSEAGLGYIIAEYYTKTKRKPRGAHPRDILDTLVDIARFRGVPPTLSHDLMDQACQAYFMQH